MMFYKNTSIGLVWPPRRFRGKQWRRWYRRFVRFDL